MEHSTERRFVRSFIIKTRQERLLHELTTPSKRYQGISRFCHQAEGLLNPSKISMSGTDLEQRSDFTDFVKEHNEPCSVFSPDLRLDEQILPLKEAVGKAVLCLDAVLIVGSTYAIVFGEAMKDGRDKYLVSSCM